MEIKISVENVDLTSVIGQTYNQIGEDDYDKTSTTLGDAVAYQIAQDLKKDDAYYALQQRVMNIRTEEIRAMVRAEIEAAMNAPFRQTNRYGEPTGAETTIRSLIVDEANKFFTEKRSDGYGRAEFTDAQRVIAAEVNKALTKELTEAVAQERAKVVGIVRAKAADIIAEAVQAGFNKY